MNLMICLSGEAEQLAYLPEISALNVGIELGSYGMVGILSERHWEERLRLHKAFRNRFDGAIALYDPFMGMQYAHVDHLIRGAVERRLEMTLAAAVELGAESVVLHSGYTTEISPFGLEDEWLKRSVGFWQTEIHRWADHGTHTPGRSRLAGTGRRMGRSPAPILQSGIDDQASYNAREPELSSPVLNWLFVNFGAYRSVSIP